MEPRRGEPGREQVAGAQHPQDRAIGAGEDSGGEERGGCAIREVRPAADQLVKRTTGQAGVGQVVVDRGNAEREAAMPTRPGTALKVSDPSPELVDSKGVTSVDHESPKGRKTPMFMLCSLLTLRVNWPLGVQPYGFAVD